MEKKQRFFIYDRKEVGVLLLLGVMVAVFAFTLGVHLGKRVGGKPSASAHATPSEGVAPVAEVPPTAETEHAMAQPTSVPTALTAAAEDALNQATHDEVTRTGVKLEDSRQLELPEKTRSKNAGATHIQTKPETEHAPEKKAEHKVEHKASEPKEEAHENNTTPEQREAMAELNALTHKAEHSSSTGRYTLQIGSYSEKKEAQDRVKDLEISGLSTRISEADVKGKGHWYRIYLGGFATKAEAEKAGKKYHAQGVIDSFIVTKSVE